MAFRLQKQIIQIFVFHNFIDVSVDFVPEFFLSGKEKIIFSRLSSFSWVLVVFRPDLVKDLEFKSNLRTSLTRFFPMFPSDALEKIKKPLVFWCFQGDQKRTLGRKKLKKWSFTGSFIPSTKKNPKKNSTNSRNSIISGYHDVWNQIFYQ